jgi:translocation and assembly module TamA
MNRFYFYLSMVLLVSFSQAEEIKSASRWDIAMTPYKYELQGELVRAIKEYRTAVNQTGIQPSTDRQIRAERDREEQLLKSRGYYRALITSAFSEDKQKPKYKIELGTRYRISKIAIKGNFHPFDDKWTSVKIGEPLSAVLVLAQQVKLKKYIEERTCYFSAEVNHEVTLDESAQTAVVTFITKVAAPSIFGRVAFVGIDGIHEDFLSRVSGIGRKQCYNRSKIDSAVIALFETGLFSQVRPTVTQNDAGQVIVTFTVQKRKKRTVNASAGWKSEQGFGVKAGWQHRDLFGSAQSLSLSGSIQSLEQDASIEVVIPSFFDRRNRLSWTNSVEHLDQPDLEAYVWSSIATMERKASVKDYFEFGVGYSQVEQNSETDEIDGWTRFQQLRVPLKYQYDSVENPFNPQSGNRFTATVEPIFDINDDLTPFIKSGLGLQTFISSDQQLTLASRVKWDSLWYGGALGSTLENIPETELYNAGGSTSIRGYAYQSIKSDDSEDATGGSQRWLAVNELRAQINDSWGVVGFMDVGSVGDSSTILEKENWFAGAGFGVRYFTRFAPLRMDVSFPLNQRDDDANFLIYVSLGQAF